MHTCKMLSEDKNDFDIIRNSYWSKAAFLETGTDII